MAFFDRFRATVGQVLRVKETPHRIALAFAVGVFLGVSPLLGLHTIIAFALAWLFRLNRLVTVSGSLVNNPWSIIPIYTFSTWVGTLVLDTELSIGDVNWNKLTLSTLLSDLENLIVPFILGSVLVGIVSAVTSYFLVRKAAEN